MQKSYLTIDNNEFILGSACISSENYWDHKIIENLLLRHYFKILSRKTETIHQQRVGCLSHAVTEHAVGKWCQRLPLAFVLQKDILSTCWNEDDVMWHVIFLVIVIAFVAIQFIISEPTHTLPDRNSLLSMAKQRLLHFTRYCSDNVKVRWPNLKTFASSFFLMPRAKNYWNRPMFHGAIEKNNSGNFLWTKIH